MGLNTAQSVGSESVRMSDRFSFICISAYINLSCDSPSKQEEAMELKQEVTKSDYIVVYISNYIPRYYGNCRLRNLISAFDVCLSIAVPVGSSGDMPEVQC